MSVEGEAIGRRPRLRGGGFLGRHDGIPLAAAQDMRARGFFLGHLRRIALVAPGI